MKTAILDDNKLKLSQTQRRLLRDSHPLQRLKERNTNTKHTNQKIYHLLCDPSIYIQAYAKIIKNRGSTTPGIPSDEQLLIFFGRKDAISIAKTMQKGKYSFSPCRRTLIPKPGKNKKRPIDTPTQKDRIVQEAIRGILESIYEPVFREHANLFASNPYCKIENFGFRPNLNCWQAAETLKIHGQRCTYIIEGDIKGAYNNVNHQVLLKVLRKRIKDPQFLTLLHNLLRSGVMENGTYTHNLKGTPQGGIVSPLLFNIYMFELDKFTVTLANKVLKNNTTKTGKRNPEYQRNKYQKEKILKLYRNPQLTHSERKTIKKQLKKHIITSFKTPSYLISDLPKSCLFIRYADDWVFAFTGTYSEAKDYKKTISNFISSDLHMELDDEKTKITKYTDSVQFLGFSLKMEEANKSKQKLVLTKSKGKYKRVHTRTTSKKINIRIDKKRLLKNLVQRGFCKPDLFPIGIRSWSLFSTFEIVTKYRQILVGLYGYYCKCDSSYTLNQVSYILQYSCAKTIATREKITMKQVFTKYGMNLSITRVTYRNGTSRKENVSFKTYTQLRNSTISKY